MSALGRLRFVPTSTISTSAALIFSVRMSRRISVMPGCVSEPQGYGLMETPGLGNVQGGPGFVEKGGGIVAAAKSAEEASVSFQYLFSASPAQSRQVSGKDSDLGRMAGME